MEKETIIEKLENGEYTVEQERCCGCSIESISNQTGILLDARECWRVSYLFVEDGDGTQLLVAQKDCVCGDEDLFEGLTLDDIPEEALEALREYGDLPQHDPGDLEEMIRDYLTENELVVVLDPQRGFANEYKMILCSESEAKELVDACDDFEILDEDDACERLDRYKTEDFENPWVAIANYEDYHNLLESKEE